MQDFKNPDAGFHRVCWNGLGSVFRIQTHLFRKVWKFPDFLGSLIFMVFSLIRMQASGIIHKLKTTHHTIETDSDYYSVNWDQILLILTVLMVGVLLSSIILFFEQCLGRNRKKNDQVLVAYDGLCYSFTESEQKLFINFAYTNTKKTLQPKAKQQK